jgi:CO/xanthine dehydrogenase Mo-binding subunit
VAENRAAHELGIDSVEIRRHNFVQPNAIPYRIPLGNEYDSSDDALTLDRALELADYRSLVGRYVWPG